MRFWKCVSSNSAINNFTVGNVYTTDDDGNGLVSNYGDKNWNKPFEMVYYEFEEIDKRNTIDKLKEGVLYKVFEDSELENNIYKIEDGKLKVKFSKSDTFSNSSLSYNNTKEAYFIEYNPTPPTDWSKVEVDAKILVSNSKDRFWYKRHFAKFEDGKVYTWMDGETSWSSEDDEDIIPWLHYKLATEESEE